MKDLNKSPKKTNVSLLRIIRNISSPLVFFIVLYILFNNLFMFTLLNPVSYLSGKVEFSIFLKDYLSESIYYIYPIILLSATFTMLLLAAFRLYRRSGAIISILIFTILLSAYPAFMIIKGENYKLDFRKYRVSKTERDSDIMRDTKLRSGYLTTLNNYTVYVQNAHSTYSYKNVLLNKAGVNEPIYVADTLGVDKDILHLKNVLIIDHNKDIIKLRDGVNIKFNEGVRDSFKKSISGVHLLEPINMIIYKFMDNKNTLYSFVLFFVSLFLFFVSSYLLIASVSSPVHMLHNILAVILSYYIFVITFYFISRTFNIVSIITSYSILKLSAFVLAYDIIAIILALILKSLFNFNEYYSKERV